MDYSVGTNSANEPVDPQTPTGCSKDMDSNGERPCAQELTHCCVEITPKGEPTCHQEPPGCNMFNPVSNLTNSFEPFAKNYKDTSPLLNEPASEGHPGFEGLEMENDNLESEVDWLECTKNPGHPDFIPITEFSFKHLTRPCQRQEVVSMIKAAADLTVRLRVKSIDTNRPEEFAVKGNNTSGTGYIIGITKATRACCHRTSVQPWYLDILTASHVIYSSTEAKNTRVDMFYNDEDSLRHGKVKTVKGMRVFNSHEEGDWSYLQCEIEDEALAETLKQCIDHYKVTELCMKKVPKSSVYFNTAVVISHPHGKPKMVTVGNMSKMSGQNRVRLIPEPFICSANVCYDADTCAGSSGAPVFWLGSRSKLIHRMPDFEDKDRDLCSLHCPSILSSIQDAPARGVTGALLLIILLATVHFYDINPSSSRSIEGSLVFQIFEALFLWCGILTILRGYRLTDALTSLKVIKTAYRKRDVNILYRVAVEKSGVSSFVAVFDFGPAILINLCQDIFLAIVSQHDIRIQDTLAIASVFIMGLIVVIMVAFLCLIYFQLRYHLLSSLLLWQRMCWGLGCTISIICFSINYKFLYGLPVSAVFISLFLYNFCCWFWLAITICAHKWPQPFDKVLVYLDTTLSFIHSRRGKDGFNESCVCIKRL